MLRTYSVHVRVCSREHYPDITNQSANLSLVLYISDIFPCFEHTLYIRVCSREHYPDITNQPSNLSLVLYISAIFLCFKHTLYIRVVLNTIQI